MKTKEQILKELENIGIFEIKNGERFCTGYKFDLTIEFVKLHRYIKYNYDDIGSMKK